MNPHLDSLLTSIVGSDWKTMNIDYGEVLLNIPASIFLAVLLTAMLIGVFFVIRMFFCVSHWRRGYDDGYEDGMHAKAIKLSKIKFCRDSTVIVCNVNPKEVEQGKEEALRQRE